MTHAGHVYAVRSADEVPRIGREEGERMASLAERLASAGFPCATVSVGSTPTAPFAAEVAGITEIRPGNYVFHDMTQVALGSAAIEDCALSVLATVISRPDKGRAVIDAGAKSLALDRGAHGTQQLEGYGYLPSAGRWVSRLSEEHGVIAAPAVPWREGDRVRIIPNHACPVANLFACAWVVEDDRVLDCWTVDARSGAP